VAAQQTHPRDLWRRELGGTARRVADTLRLYGPRTRAELVSLSGLSAAPAW